MSFCWFKWPRFASERRVPQLIYHYSSGEVKSWSETPAIQFGLDDQIWCVFQCLAKLFSSNCNKSEKENQIHCIWKWFPSSNSPSSIICLKKLTGQLVKVRQKCDQKFSMRWFATDVSYLCASAFCFNMQWAAAMTPVSFPWSVLSISGTNPRGCTALIYIAATTIGLLFVLHTFRQITLRKKPSTAP